MGFKTLHPPFTISKMETDNPDEKLPTSSTCFNIFRLPPYSNAKLMKERIITLFILMLDLNLPDYYVIYKLF